MSNPRSSIPLTAEQRRQAIPLEVEGGNGTRNYDSLINKPTLNGITIEGDHDGEYYGLAYTHRQDLPSSVWEIHHNLNRYPSVTVVDTAGTRVVGDVVYVDSNTVICTFCGAFGGVAYLN